MEHSTRTLSDADIEAIVNKTIEATGACAPCKHEFTKEEAHELKGFARILMRTKNVIGNTILYAIVAGFVVLFYLGASKLRG